MSPYEADKIIPKSLSETDLGKDLLSQDYILKQLSASLTYPESDTGKDFWSKTYQEVLKVAKTTKLPVNTFNKIWIMPDKAVVYEHDNFAMVSQATLKTMLEEDYLALKNNVSSIQKQKNMKEGLINQVNAASSKVMRETILPKINADVNSGKNFATLRQIYYSLILGVWFKKKFKDSLYKAYINQGKIKGIDLADKNAKDKIYNLYVEAFKKGIYNYIKPEKDLGTGRKIKRQYFSGGATMLGVDSSTIRKDPGSNEAVIVAAPTLGPAERVVIDVKQAGSPITDRVLIQIIDFGSPIRSFGSQKISIPTSVKEGKDNIVVYTSSERFVLRYNQNRKAFEGTIKDGYNPDSGRRFWEIFLDGEHVLTVRTKDGEDKIVFEHQGSRNYNFEVQLEEVTAASPVNNRTIEVLKTITQNLPIKDNKIMPLSDIITYKHNRQNFDCWAY